MAMDFMYGVYYMLWAFRDSNGYPIGQTTATTGMEKAAESGAYLMRNPIEFVAPTPSFARAVSRGGQSIRAQKDMGVTEFGEATFSMSELDDTLWSYWTGGSVDTATVTGWRMAGYNINQATIPDGFIVIFGKAYDYENSADKWNAWVFPNCQVRVTPTGNSQSDGENPNPWNLTLIPNTSERFITGDLFSGTGMNVADDTDLFVRVQSNNPWHVHTYREDATPANAFTLPYKPLTDESTTSDKRLTVDGSAGTLSSVSTSDGSVSTSGITDGQMAVMVYETAFVASS